jgi:molybdopterin synthase sulfurtransferase
MNLKNITVSNEFVKEVLGKPEYVVVDARSSHGFIGWRLEGELNVGHIKGATDFSAD